jgi:hypothetical protein
MRGETARPFWTLVGIRVAFWLGATVTLLWQPITAPATQLPDLDLPVFRTYDARSELVFNTFSQWDAGWYLSIAQDGYRSEQASAFFPLYPLTVRALAVVTRSPVVAGVLISLVAAGVAAVLLARLARPLLGDEGARDTVLYLALYPLAFVFTAAYPEGLFLALSLGAFLAAMRGQALVAAVLGALAVATRPVGLALLPALAYLLWRRGEEKTAVAARLAPLALLPAALGAYSLYLHSRLGDALAFVHAQGTFWARHTAALGPVGGLWEALAEAYHGTAQVVLHLHRIDEVDRNWPDNIGTLNAVHFALLLAALALTWVAWTRLGPAFGLYSLVYLAIVLSSPADLFPLVSLPRFLLADFPLFLALASLTAGRPRAREIVLVSFAAVGAVAAVGFARHAWIA